MSENLEFFATCAMGFESLLAGELSSLGIKSVRPLQGQVAFTGALKDGYMACLWSRLASRVVLVLTHCDAADADELYAGINALAWEDHLPLSATFVVDAHGTNDNLRNSQFVALRAKDAICDRMQAKLGGRPNIDTRNPDIRVVVRLHGERAMAGIDFSGQPLFRRGSGAHARNDNLGGMRADYAAALLAAGGWYKLCRAANPALVSVFSGSGTVAVEAEGVAHNKAAGLQRMRWGFERWAGHDEKAWKKLLRAAEKCAEEGSRGEDNWRLIATDSRPQAESTLRKALRASGIEAAPTGEGRLLGFSQEAPSADETLAVVDLSWLGTSAQAAEVAALAEATRNLDKLKPGTPVVALGTSAALDSMLGYEPEQTIDIMLGRDAATMRLYTIPEDAATKRTSVNIKDGTAAGVTIPVLVETSDQFAARLAKVAKLRRKWAHTEDISCYRVYDADLPDYAVAIDLYQASEFVQGRDAGKRWLMVQEYVAPKEIDADLAHKRLLDVLALAPTILKVAPENVYVRQRRHAKGGSQYADGGQLGENQGRTGEGEGRNSRGARDARSGRGDKHNGRRPRLAPGAHLIDEGGLTFEVNFEDYLDTGIFLDHRDVRAEVREMAKQTKGSKRFLNLFAYTGTATCYAADGGAKYTTTVDLSTTYLDWAQRNMERNGFSGSEHEYVRANVVRWIAEQRRTHNRWDLVFCDPPTFSNSKRMGRDAFDVQRDHAELLIGISRLLTQNGVCLFSCNLRGFKPDVEKLNRTGVLIEDITEGTIPEDFARNAKIHHVYLVRRKPREESQQVSAPRTP